MPHYKLDDASYTVHGVKLSYKIKYPRGIEETKIAAIVDKFDAVIAWVKKQAEKNPDQYDLELEKDEE